jgi:hypothetical protein
VSAYLLLVERVEAAVKLLDSLALQRAAVDLAAIRRGRYLRNRSRYLASVRRLVDHGYYFGAFELRPHSHHGRDDIRAAVASGLPRRDRAGLRL